MSVKLPLTIFCSIKPYIREYLEVFAYNNPHLSTIDMIYLDSGN